VQTILDDESTVASDGLHRVGPLFAWQFRGGEGEKIGRLSAFAITQWWLQHPYRTGQVSNQGVPYVLLGCSMNGDFRPWDK